MTAGARRERTHTDARADTHAYTLDAHAGIRRNTCVQNVYAYREMDSAQIVSLNSMACVHF